MPPDALPPDAAPEDDRTGALLPPGAVPPHSGSGFWNEPAVISADAFRTRTRRAFLTGGAYALAGVVGWRWLGHTAALDDRLPWPLRRAHEANEALWRTLYNPDALAPTFPFSAARTPRVNGLAGLTGAFDPAAWTLRVEAPDGRTLAVVTPDDLRALPRTEMVTEHKCIEGWSTVVHWAGVRLSDFAARYAQAVPDHAFRYVGLVTPDRGYYVGIERAAAMHPQTLLCDTMHGAPLTLAHGAPLRLVTPLKYGVKAIKRIGTIQFASAPPVDYWAKRGYDWYTGH